MKTKLLLAAVLSLIVIVIVAVGASEIYLNSQKQIKNTPTPAPTPLASTTETPSPTVVQAPKEYLVFKEVNMGANYNFTIQVSSNSEQDITLVQAIIKDNHGAIIGTSDFNITVPANGEMTKIPLQLTTPVSIQSEPLTVTLVTENSNTFTSPEIHSPTQTAYYLNADN
jgi:hypothetical protein